MSVPHSEGKLELFCCFSKKPACDESRGRQLLPRERDPQLGGTPTVDTRLQIVAEPRRPSVKVDVEPQRAKSHLSSTVWVKPRVPCTWGGPGATFRLKAGCRCPCHLRRPPPAVEQPWGVKPAGCVPNPAEISPCFHPCGSHLRAQRVGGASLTWASWMAHAVPASECCPLQVRVAS